MVPPRGRAQSLRLRCRPGMVDTARGENLRHARDVDASMRDAVTFRAEARRYWQRAEECRAVAAELRDGEARAAVLRTADPYEDLARACEAAGSIGTTISRKP